jgi:hypothetical protein
MCPKSCLILAQGFVIGDELNLQSGLGGERLVWFRLRRIRQGNIKLLKKSRPTRIPTRRAIDAAGQGAHNLVGVIARRPPRTILNPSAGVVPR